MSADGKYLRCDGSFRRETYSDGSALAFRAVNFKRSTGQVNKTLGQGRTDALVAMFFAKFVVHLTEPRHRLGKVSPSIGLSPSAPHRICAPTFDQLKNNVINTNRNCESKNGSD